MYTIGNVSPQFPMYRIIDVEPARGRGGQNVLIVTLNGKYDGVHDKYSVPA